MVDGLAASLAWIRGRVFAKKKPSIPQAAPGVSALRSPAGPPRRGSISSHASLPHRYVLTKTRSLDLHTAAWHLTELAPNANTGVPTVVVTLTVVEAESEGPLQPFAVTETVAIPVNAASQVTVPVIPVPEIVLPAPVIGQLYDVAFAADVV